MIVAFIINDVHQIPTWYAATINAVKKSNNYTVLLIHIPLVNKAQPNSLFYQLFQNFEERYFKNSNDADKPVDVISIVQKEEIISINAASFYLDENTLDRLKQPGLDVIYTINFDVIEQENISTVASYGLWHLQPGYGKYYNSRPAAFWEVMDCSEVTGAYLLMRKGFEDVVLYEGTTTSKLFAVKNNYNNLLWKAATFLPARLQTLFSLQDNFNNRYFTTLPENKLARQQPRNAAMLQLFLKNSIGYLQHKANSKKSGQPFSLYYSLEKMNVDRLDSIQFKRIPAAVNSFYADPFVVKKDSKHYIFFEELENNKGHISVIEADEANNFSAPKKILEKPYHLSYPFVFESSGVYYMVPESSANKTVELYKADHFPYSWTFVMNLVENIALVDSTLFFYNNKWWLFANNCDASSANDQLLLFYSDELLSNNWTQHPQNPVATHAANCRPAGRIFIKNGKIYRPAQNNASQQYGFGIKINEIEVLNEKEYREKEVLDLNPKTFGLKAAHQIDFTDDMIVIDGVE